MSEHPPKPRLALAVGVIGHRPNRLPEAGRDRVAAEVARVCDRLGVEAKAALARHQEYFAAQPPQLTMVSALAEGADRIAAEAALAHGWLLDAPLPFAPEVYEADFAEQSRAAFHDLLRLARAVLALPGERREQTRAYESVGRTVLDQSDILLAVWDGGPSAGGGGTTDLLGVAARLGIPIIHVDANGQAPARLLWSELDSFPAPVDAINDLPAKELEEGLEALVEKLVAPPPVEAERHALKRYFRERFFAHNWRLEFPSLMALCRVRPMRPEDRRPFAPRILGERLSALGLPGDAAAEPSLLALAHGWADAIATHFAQVFRSAFVTNFLLAALAVVVAASSLVLDLEHAWKHWFVAIELLLIAIVLLNTFVGRQFEWHRRWFEAREVAERLRVASPLWRLGARPTSFSGREPVWTGWYARAVVRDQGLGSGTLGEKELMAARQTLLALIEDQRQYHATTTERMEKLERRLECFGLVLFGVTVVAAILFLIGHGIGHAAAHWEAVLVTALAAGLPALATASYGIRVIGDFEGIARRSERTRASLKQLNDAISQDPVGLERLRARARSAAEAMLGDVSNWRIAAESRSLNIPG